MTKERLNAEDLEHRLVDGVEKESLYIPALERDGFGLLPRLPMMGKELDLNAKALLTIIYSYAHATNADGDNSSCVAFPGRDTLMAISKMSIKTYYNALKTLLDTGFVTIKQDRQQCKSGRNVWGHNVYILEMQPKCYKNGDVFVYDADLYTRYRQLGINCKGRGAIYKKPLLAKVFTTKGIAAYGYICTYNCFGTCRLNLAIMQNALGMGRNTFAALLKELNNSGYLRIERIRAGHKYTDEANFIFTCPDSDLEPISDNCEAIEGSCDTGTDERIIIEDDITISVSADTPYTVPDTDYSVLDDECEDFEEDDCEEHSFPNRNDETAGCSDTSAKTFDPEIIMMPMGVEKVERVEKTEPQPEMAIGNKEDRHANLAYKKFQFSTEGPWGYVGDALNHLAIRLSIQQVADHAWIQPVNDLMQGIKNLVDQINGNNLIEVGGCGWYAPTYVLQRFADLPENQCLAALRRYVGMDHARIYDKPTYLLTMLWNEMNDPKYYSYVAEDAEDYWA